MRKVQLSRTTTPHGETSNGVRLRGVIDLRRAAIEIGAKQRL
jgi:hypothetical protein